MKARKARFEVLLLAAVVATAIWGAASAASTQRDARLVWLFSQNARFVTIDLDQERVVDVGNLWYMGIQEIDSVIPWPSNGIPAAADEELEAAGDFGTEPAEWEARGLAVLVRGAFRVSPSSCLTEKGDLVTLQLELAGEVEKPTNRLIRGVFTIAGPLRYWPATTPPHSCGRFRGSASGKCDSAHSCVTRSWYKRSALVCRLARCRRSAGGDARGRVPPFKR